MRPDCIRELDKHIKIFLQVLRERCDDEKQCKDRVVQQVKKTECESPEYIYTD